jgi:hypothetical protein
VILLARIRVEESDGIRRFLYPLSLTLPWDLTDAAQIRLADIDGQLIPSEAFTRGKKTRIDFAISLAPHEKRRFLVVHTSEAPEIPDRLHCSRLPGEGLTTVQERVAFRIDSAGQLASVVYDAVEHLAGPVAFRLDGSAPVSSTLRPGGQTGKLSVTARAQGFYPEDVRFRTDYALTACKSWIQIDHRVDRAPGGSTLELAIPLTAPEPGETPTCDFGLGSGSYCKIDAEAVVMDAVIGRGPHARWTISRVSGEAERVDYQDRIGSAAALRSRSWFHWTLASRSIAVAATHLPPACRLLQFHLAADGQLHVAATLGANPAPRTRLGICCHFLNAIPPIAAATNPASILLPPALRVSKLGH